MNFVKHFILIWFFFPILAHAQLKSNYARGFEIGFAEGYCYNNETVDCFRPITPLAPLPRINENKEDYTQGYNRGFQYGLDLKRSEDAFDEPNITLHNRLVRFNDYVSQQPVSAMIAVGMLKQEKYDARLAWIKDRMRVISNLLSTLYRNIPDGKTVIKLEQDFISKKLNPYSRADLADDNQFRAVQNILYSAERMIYENYNSIVESDKNEDSVTNDNNNSKTVNGSFTNSFKTKYIGKNFIYRASKLAKNSTNEKTSAAFSHTSNVKIYNDRITFENNNRDVLTRYYNQIVDDSKNNRFICYSDHGMILIDADLIKIIFLDLDRKPSYYYALEEMKTNDSYQKIVQLIQKKEKDIINEMNELGSTAADDQKYDVLRAKQKDLYKDALPQLIIISKQEPQNIEILKTIRDAYSVLGDYKNMNIIKSKIQELSKY